MGDPGVPQTAHLSGRPQLPGLPDSGAEGGSLAPLHCRSSSGAIKTTPPTARLMDRIPLRGIGVQGDARARRGVACWILCPLILISTGGVGGAGALAAQKALPRWVPAGPGHGPFPAPAPVPRRAGSPPSPEAPAPSNQGSSAFSPGSAGPLFQSGPLQAQLRATRR